MHWLTGRWSPPLRLSQVIEQEWWQNFSDDNAYLGGGVYRLIGLESNDDQIIPAIIHRVCGSDSIGTLYVGTTDILFHRVGALIRTHRPDYFSRPHKPLLDRMAALPAMNR